MHEVKYFTRYFFVIQMIRKAFIVLKIVSMG